MIIGRHQVIGELAQSNAPITLVIGDSGVGKSTVLQAAQQMRLDAVAIPPVAVRRTPGALQVALLEALGAAVSELSQDEHAATRVGRVMVEAARRVGEKRFGDLGAAVGKYLLNQVRRRVGDELAAVVGDFVSELSTSVEELLENRITSASDPDVLEVFLDFAREAAGLADTRPILLALDNLHHLDPADQARFAELVVALPDGVMIRGAFTAARAEQRGRADLLAEAGVTPIQLPGLEAGDIRQWIQQEGLPESVVPAILQVTNGYALHVRDAIALLKGGASLEDLDVEDVVVAGTRLAWGELDIESQLAAARLAAFSRPISAERVTTHLNLSLGAWGTLEAQLRDSGIFTGQTQLWFHELRRRALWSDVLTETQRRDAVQLAFREVTSQLSLPSPSPEIHLEYALLATNELQAASDDPHFNAMLAADRDELAVLAALVELAERDQPVAIAELALLHAHETFASTGDLLPALHQLVDRDLVHVTSNEHAAVAGATLHNINVYRLLVGRVGNELGRLPLPRAATTLFDSALRARLGQFRSAQFGIGRPRVALLADTAEKLQMQGPDGALQLGRKGPNLLVRAAYGSMPFYAAIAFEDAAERDQAAVSIESVDEQILDQRFQCVDVLRHPMTAVPSKRFVVAAELLRNENLPIFGVPKSSEDLDLAEMMSKRAAFLELARTRCSDEELLAYGLDLPMGYIYFSSEDGFIRAVVVGTSGARELAQGPSTSFNDPFHRLELARIAGLAAGQHISTIHYSGKPDRDDPILSEIASASSMAANYNKTLNRKRFVFEESQLEASISAALARTADDAAALSAIGLAPNHTPLSGATIYIAVELDDPNPGFVAAAFAIAIIAPIANESGEHRARVRIFDRGTMSRPGWEETPTWLSDVFDIAPPEVTSVSHSDARIGLSKLLGYSDRETEFQMP